MRALLPLLLCASLVGCASGPRLREALETRVACTVDGGSAWVLSKWWLFAVGTELSPKDAPAVCGVE